jgi:hypothetical protein
MYGLTGGGEKRRGATYPKVVPVLELGLLHFLAPLRPPVTKVDKRMSFAFVAPKVACERSLILRSFIFHLSY